MVSTINHLSSSLIKISYRISMSRQSSAGRQEQIAAQTSCDCKPYDRINALDHPEQYCGRDRCLDEHCNCVSDCVQRRGFAVAFNGGTYALSLKFDRPAPLISRLFIAASVGHKPNRRMGQAFEIRTALPTRRSRCMLTGFEIAEVMCNSDK